MPFPQQGASLKQDQAREEKNIIMFGQVLGSNYFMGLGILIFKLRLFLT